MIEGVISPMGGGKTMYSVLEAYNYSLEFPDNKIFSNFNINLDNCIYNPFMLINFNTDSNCMVIFDDIYAMKNLESLIGVIVNCSRKANLEIIMTGQYYTMIPPKIRTLSKAVQVKYGLFPDYYEIGKSIIDDSIGIDYTIEWSPKLQIKKGDWIEGGLGEIDFKEEKYALDPVKTIGDLYNTNQIVTFVNERLIESEIEKHSKTLEELDDNIAIMYASQSRREKLYKKLSKLEKFL